MLISYSFYRSISNPFNIVTSLDNRHKYRIHDVTLNRIKLSFKNMCLFMCYVRIKDNIYYGCFIHNHIGMNKLLRKIVFTDMAIRGMPKHLIIIRGWQSAHKRLGRNISGLAICVKKIRDVILRGW